MPDSGCGWSPAAPRSPATSPKHRALPGNGKETHIPQDREEWLDESLPPHTSLRKSGKNKWIPNGITGSLGPWLGVYPTATASRSRWMQCLAQSQCGAGSKAPINSFAEAAACGGSVRKSLCCCNVFLVALCTLQTDLASGHCYPGILPQDLFWVFTSNTCHSLLHFSELAPNAGPRVTIYCWFCCLRISHKANKSYQTSHSQSVLLPGLGDAPAGCSHHLSAKG